MRVKCKYNNLNDIASIPTLYRLLSESCLTDGGVFPLTIGKCYVVYAMTIKDNFIWYYIADDTFSYYPVIHSATMFEIVDTRLSKYWEIGTKHFSDKRLLSCCNDLFICFEEWNKNPYFYERILERDSNETKVFLQYKTLFDEEYDNPQ